MNLDLTQKTALICGSTAGIGKAIATELALLGADCILFARNEAKLKTVLSELPVKPGQKHSYLVADFSDYENVEASLQLLDQPVNILINNTGGPAAGPVSEASIEAFQKAFNQHIVCNQLITSKVLEGMKAENYGRIINIISTSVRVPIKNLGVSNTIRGAVASWAKTLSTEVAPYGITVNNVLPGSTKTGRITALIEDISQKTGKSTEEVTQNMYNEIPMQRFAEVEEIASIAAFLSTPAAAYITGVSIQADGGRIGSI